MNLIPNFITNCDDIVKICIENKDKFIPRREMGGHGGPLTVFSRFSTYYNDKMEDWFIDLIFENSNFDSDLRDLYSFIQIQRYDPGDFIVPHRDNYYIKKLHLVVMTNSEYDGLTLQNEKDLIKIYDKAGQKIDADFNNWHWVDPVKDTRFSLVIGE